MMDDYWTHQRENKNYMRLNKTEIDPQGHATTIFTDWAVDYIMEKTKKEAPFFLYLAYNAPHFPIQPPKKWLEKVKQREGDIDEKRAKNIALVEHLDYEVGRVINSLKESGQYENTVIVFSSDNGGLLSVGASNGDLRGGKLDMYEGGIKVPTCMVWKGHIEPGKVAVEPGLTMDFYPTLCKIADVEITHEIDGIDLLPGILNKEKKQIERMTFFMRRDGYDIEGFCYYAARKGPYKLVQNRPFEKFQLFNIETDPQETTPLEENNEHFVELKFGLSQHIRKSGAIPWQKSEE
jgi:arylsulfatase A-like enzyme